MAPRRTLVLNASYEPLGTVTWQRAVILALAGEAEVIEADGTPVRSQFLTVVLPKVVRLFDFRTVPYRARSPLTRRGVLARDSDQCCYCDRRKATTVDHVQPRSRGGRHIWENVVGCCSPCNQRKDARTPAEAGMAMRFQPRVPTGNIAMVIAVGRVDPTWESYLGIEAVA